MSKGPPVFKTDRFRSGVEKGSLMTAFRLRSVERLLIVLTAALAIFLGYRLYTYGIAQGAAEFSFGQFMVNGQGPGIAFAIGGILVLILCVRSQVSVYDRGPFGVHVVTDLGLESHLSNEAYAKLQREAEGAGTSPTKLAATCLERQYGSQDIGLRQTDAEKQAARERFERHFGRLDLGHATGVDNDQIDADLAREFADNHQED